MNFGEDIIVEILSRLPVKSLLKFRCVCKDWCQIIDSSVFICKHYNQENNHSRLLVQYYPPVNEHYCHFALFTDKDLRGAPPVHEDLYKKLEIGQIFGPVNGLFFLHCGLSNPSCLSDPMAIWNPATRQLRPIKYPKPTIPSYCSIVNHVFGLGFDCLSNDYKVICFRCYWNDETDSLFGDTEVTIYSSSKDSWSSPMEIFSQPTDSLRSTFINGAYYWLSYHMTDRLTCGYSILSFDLDTEVFRDLQIPDDMDGCFLDEGVLMLYDDHLAMLISDFRSRDQHFHHRRNMETFYHMWKMEEEGCWIKLFKIGPYQYWAPAEGIWKNNELLIPDRKSGQLLIYNIDTSETKDLGLYTDPNPDNRIFYTYSYKESLVSVESRTNAWVLFGSKAKDCK